MLYRLLRHRAKNRRSGGPKLIRTQLELGGKDPAYMHSDIYDEFLEAFLVTVQGFALGDPTESNTYLGPVSRQPQLDVLANQVADALSKGATLRGGGETLDRPGWYFAPPVLTEVNPTMTVMHEETFGPVIGFQRAG